VDSEGLESVVGGTVRGHRPLRGFGERLQPVELGATDSAPSFSKGDLGDSEGTVLLVTDGAGDLGVAEALPVQRIENAERFVTLCLVEVRHALTVQTFVAGRESAVSCGRL